MPCGPLRFSTSSAMGALCLHLNHGIWSMLQTLGWNTARNQTTLKTVSRVIAIVVFLGFSSVPVSVYGRLVALIDGEEDTKCWKQEYRRVQLSRSGTSAASR